LEVDIMRASSGWLLAALTIAAAVPARAAPEEGEGLKLQLPSLQGRVLLGMRSAQPDVWPLAGQAGDARLAGASMLGDYYFRGRYATRDGDGGGFRATTGLYLGPRAQIWGTSPAPTSYLGAFNVERHSFSLASPAWANEGEDSTTVPYLGLGYSGHSLKGSFSYSADLGLMALNPGSALRFGRTFGSGQSLDDLMRDLRLSPVLQLGVSYSF
jgi:hypothetical protein